MSEIVRYEAASLLFDPNQFEHGQRVARLMSVSQLFPEHLRSGAPDQTLANAFMILELARAMGESPLMVAQQLFFVRGTAGWKTAYMIACARRRGGFETPINWRVETLGDDIVIGRQRLKNIRVEAYAKMRGAEVAAEADMQMAIGEGWTRRSPKAPESPSKYETMGAHMLRWRAATYLIRFYCPEVMMGMPASDELEDMEIARMRDVTPRRSPSPEDGERLIPPQGSGRDVGRAEPENLAPAPSPAAHERRAVPGVASAPQGLGRHETMAEPGAGSAAPSSAAHGSRTVPGVAAAPQGLGRDDEVTVTDRGAHAPSSAAHESSASSDNRLAPQSLGRDDRRAVTGKTSPVPSPAAHAVLPNPEDGSAPRKQSAAGSFAKTRRSTPAPASKSRPADKRAEPGKHQPAGQSRPQETPSHDPAAGAHDAPNLPPEVEATIDQIQSALDQSRTTGDVEAISDLFADQVEYITAQWPDVGAEIAAMVDAAREKAAEDRS